MEHERRLAGMQADQLQRMQALVRQTGPWLPPNASNMATSTAVVEDPGSAPAAPSASSPPLATTPQKQRAGASPLPPPQDPPAALSLPGGGAGGVRSPARRSGSAVGSRPGGSPAGPADSSHSIVSFQAWKTDAGPPSTAKSAALGNRRTGQAAANPPLPESADELTFGAPKGVRDSFEFHGFGSASPAPVAVGSSNSSSASDTPSTPRAFTGTARPGSLGDMDGIGNIASSHDEEGAEPPAQWFLNSPDDDDDEDDGDDGCNTLQAAGETAPQAPPVTFNPPFQSTPQQSPASRPTGHSPRKPPSTSGRGNHVVKPPLLSTPQRVPKSVHSSGTAVRGSGGSFDNGNASGSGALRRTQPGRPASGSLRSTINTMHSKLASLQGPKPKPAPPPPPAAEVSLTSLPVDSSPELNQQLNHYKQHLKAGSGAGARRSLGHI